MPEWRAMIAAARRTTETTGANAGSVSGIAGGPGDLTGLPCPTEPLDVTPGHPRLVAKVQKWEEGNAAQRRCENHSAKLERLGTEREPGGERFRRDYDPTKGISEMCHVLAVDVDPVLRVGLHGTGGYQLTLTRIDGSAFVTHPHLAGEETLYSLHPMPAPPQLPNRLLQHSQCVTAPLAVIDVCHAVFYYEGGPP